MIEKYCQKFESAIHIKTVRTEIIDLIDRFFLSLIGMNPIHRFLI
jgi:hypothetical protein